jgi:hypothetical protein
MSIRMTAGTGLVVLLTACGGAAPAPPTPRLAVRLSLAVDAAARPDSAPVFDALRDALNAQPNIRLLPPLTHDGVRQQVAEYMVAGRLTRAGDSLRVVVHAVDIRTGRIGPAHAVSFTREALRRAADSATAHIIGAP